MFNLVVSIKVTFSLPNNSCILIANCVLLAMSSLWPLHLLLVVSNNTLFLPALYIEFYYGYICFISFCYFYTLFEPDIMLSSFINWIYFYYILYIIFHCKCHFTRWFCRYGCCNRFSIKTLIFCGKTVNFCGKTIFIGGKTCNFDKFNDVYIKKI